MATNYISEIDPRTGKIVPLSSTPKSTNLTQFGIPSFTKTPTSTAPTVDNSVSGLSLSKTGAIQPVGVNLPVGSQMAAIGAGGQLVPGYTGDVVKAKTPSLTPINPTPVATPKQQYQQPVGPSVVRQVPIGPQQVVSQQMTQQPFQTQQSLQPTGIATEQPAQPERTFDQRVDEYLSQYGISRPSSASPINAFAETYKQISQQLGLPTIQAQFEQFTQENQKLLDELSGKVARVNENPWLTEGARRRQISALEGEYQSKSSNVTNRLSILQNLLARGQEEAQFVASQVAAENRSQQQFQQETLREVVDRVQKELMAERAMPEGFQLSEGQMRYEFNPQTGQFEVIAGQPKSATQKRDTQITTIGDRQVLVDTQTGEIISELGGAAGKPLTVDESKARQFAVSANEANQVLSTVQYDPGWVELPWVPNVLKSAERQQFEQAARAFVNSTLRRESGATITDDEFKNKYQELIPKAGDSGAVKEQKARARANAVRSIQEAGRVSPQSDLFNQYRSNPAYKDLSDDDIRSVLQEEGFNNVGADTQTGTIDRLKSSIIQQESGGRYNAVGAETKHGKALGRYQIIPKFHFAKIGLKDTEADRQKFLKSPELQDKLFGVLIEELNTRYKGDPRKIAAAYYGGDGAAQIVGTSAANKKQTAGGKEFPSINEYVNQVLSRV